MKIFEIKDGICCWETAFESLEKAEGIFENTGKKFVEAPNYVFEGWGYDEAKEGEERFIKPEYPTPGEKDLILLEINKLQYELDEGDKKSEQHRRELYLIEHGVDVELSMSEDEFLNWQINRQEKVEVIREMKKELAIEPSAGPIEVEPSYDGEAGYGEPSAMPEPSSAKPPRV